MYKAVIFDLDGTIAETTESMAVAGNKMLNECGLKEREWEEYKYFAGDGADMLVKRALIAAGDKECKLFEKAYAIYKDFFEKDCMYKVTQIKGMSEVLDELKKKNIIITVLTNKPHERGITVVESLYGKNYFDFILGQKDNFPKKPNPEGAYLTAKKFGLTPLECIYVGDTNVDMQTGKNAGMYTIGVLWGFRDRKELEDNDADLIISRPEELLECFI